jgi:hypothetical protein
MMFQWVKDWRPSTTIDPKDPQKRLHQDCKGEYCEAGEELQDQNTSAGKIGHGGMVCCPGHIDAIDPRLFRVNSHRSGKPMVFLGEGCRCVLKKFK